MGDSGNSGGGPAFLGIGAMRAGTTWLHRNLAAHPGLWLPPVKEVHYFDAQRDGPFWNAFYASHLKARLRAWRHPSSWSAARLRWDLTYFLSPRSDDWYRALFRPARDRLAGEITPAYSVLSPEQIRGVARFAPDLKILFLMRNPLERAWSQVMHGVVVRRGLRAEELPVEELRARLLRGLVRDRSDYPAILDRWTACFGAERIFTAFFEEIAERPRDLLVRLFDFLGVAQPEPAWFEAERVRSRVNASGGSSLAVPSSLLRALASEYRDILAELDRRFGGHAARWHREALAILGGPGDACAAGIAPEGRRAW